MDSQHSADTEETPIPSSLEHLIDQPIDVPRVRDMEGGEERPLESYQAMMPDVSGWASAPDGLAETILLGLAQGDYERVARQGISDPHCRRIWPQPIVGESALSRTNPKGPGGLRLSGRGSSQRPLGQWHKRENVVSYLPKEDQSEWRKKLQRAYREPTYEAAKERLTDLHVELQQINRKASRSLQEGFEETLTLHRLGLFEKLGRNLKTTNGIENLMGQVSRRIGKVKRWHHSPP